ncbi:hypothetical protein GL279_18740 [Paracoccus limosus]|uniref:Uncharacterized protein n=1 Tax=Paracoccus limosus TaxID=913252 RepID=A0A844H6H6_9RHOB|nr:hypothetical protein [Paracoccus limosus]MTH36619.1 hypothetical protein [Paracoccus limosus]
MARRRRSPVPTRLRRLAKELALPGMVEAPMPTGKNPSARRTRRLARKSWLIGWPFSRGEL